MLNAHHCALYQIISGVVSGSRKGKTIEKNVRTSLWYDMMLFEITQVSGFSPSPISWRYDSWNSEEIWSEGFERTFPELEQRHGAGRSKYASKDRARKFVYVEAIADQDNDLVVLLKQVINQMESGWLNYSRCARMKVALKNIKSSNCSVIAKCVIIILFEGIFWKRFLQIHRCWTFCDHKTVNTRWYSQSQPHAITLIQVSRSEDARL